MGDDIPYVPNKRTGRVCIGGKIAPIFFNTMEDSGEPGGGGGGGRGKEGESGGTREGGRGNGKEGGGEVGGCVAVGGAGSEGAGAYWRGSLLPLGPRGGDGGGGGGGGAGALPIEMDVSKFKTGDVIDIYPYEVPHYL